METRRKSSKVVASVLALAGLVVFSVMGYAGSLEPTAPPAPTMKTLDEVEPRIPISQADIPKVIVTPGSYYLTEDISAAVSAITVIVDDVTIDLCGFTLTGPNNGIGYGVYMNSRKNVEIRNGTIRKFERGIYEATNFSRDHRVIGIRALGNTTQGIFLNGNGHLVTNCTASDNGDSAVTDVYGIYANTFCTVRDNIARHNGNSARAVVHGIYAGEGCMVTGNMSCSNATLASGANVYGIRVGSGSTVTSNTAYSNGYSASTNVYGIRASTGSTVTGNTAYYNGTSAGGTVYGIYLGGNNLVDQNTAYDNNTGSGGTNMNNPGNCTFGTNHAP